MEENEQKNQTIDRFKTIPKTLMFFESDIIEAKNKGYTPKEVFRLGMMAKEGNTQMLERIRELESLNNKLSTKMQLLAKRLYEIEGEVKI